MSLNVSRKRKRKEDTEQTFNEMKELKKEERRKKALDEGKNPLSLRCWAMAQRLRLCRFFKSFTLLEKYLIKLTNESHNGMRWDENEWWRHLRGGSTQLMKTLDANLLFFNSTRRALPRHWVIWAHDNAPVDEQCNFVDSPFNSRSLRRNSASFSSRLPIPRARESIWERTFYNEIESSITWLRNWIVWAARENEKKAWEHVEETY